MTVNLHPNLIQGSEEWYAIRCGLLTASEMKLVITPTLKHAANEKERNHLYELLAQRITRYIEPKFVGDDMLRGLEDEITARALYSKHYAPVTEVGFITNDRFGFTLGYSPDGLVGDAGLIECKSRRQKYQIETVIEAVPKSEIPADFIMQIQTGLLVSEREWLDFISYSGGLPMIVIRAYPDEEIQDAIVSAAGSFERRIAEKMEKYRTVLESRRFLPTERRVYEEITL